MQYRNRFNSIDELLKEAEFQDLLENAKRLGSRQTKHNLYQSEPTNQEESKPPHHDPTPKVFGPYQLRHSLGQGGMGRVYLAQQTGANREVALKIIRPEFLVNSSDSEQFVSRFRREAQVMANLNHDNIVPVFEVGEFESQLFYSMRLIDGASLSDELKTGPLEPIRAAKIIRQCASAVEEAHRAGILHRDIKPSNILIEKSGRPYISDFGLAKRSDESASELTQTGALVGTACYMSPEQAKDASRIREPSDVYSLGAVLYATLTGRPPFQTSNPYETIRQVIADDPVSPRKINPAIPKDLDTICLKCLDKRPQDRYRSADDLAKDLDNFLHSRPITAKRASPLAKARLWCGRNRSLTALLLTIVLSAIILVAVFQQYSSNLRNASTSFKVDQIATVENVLLPGHILALRAEPNFDPNLVRQRFASESDPDLKFRYALTICNIDNDCRNFVLDRALESEPRQIELILNRDLIPELELHPIWETALSQNELPDTRMRACCILARLEPTDERWPEISEDLAPTLLELDTVSAANWIPLLSPVLPKFESEFVESSLSDTPSIAASIGLAEIYQNQPVKLLNHLANSTIDHFPILFEKVSNSETTVRALKSKIEELNGSEVEDEISKSVNLLACAIRLGEITVREAFEQAKSPPQRLLLADRLGKLGCDITRIIAAVNDDKLSDNHLRLVLCALCNYQNPNAKFRFNTQSNRSLESYLTHPNCGVRSAAEFALKKWDTEIRFDSTDGSREQLGWYRTAEGQVMSVIDTEIAELPRMRRRQDQEGQPVRRLPFRTYSISTCEITQKEYQKFLDDSEYQKLHQIPPILNNHDESFGPVDQCPANFVSYDLAAAYCNWLSYRERLPETQWCYRKQGNSMLLKDDAFELSGYRLPTEFEWDNATGELGHLIDYDSTLPICANVGDTAGKTTHIVGALFPNQFGLFDLCGNIMEWTIRNDDFTNRSQSYRGGDVTIKPEFIRVNLQNFAVADFSLNTFGFRITRIIQSGD